MNGKTFWMLDGLDTAQALKNTRIKSTISLIQNTRNLKNRLDFPKEQRFTPFMKLRDRIDKVAGKTSKRYFEQMPTTCIGGKIVIMLTEESMKLLVNNAMVDGAAVATGLIVDS